ncbi:hypothetical protein GCM10027161_67180 [Microbispora hainanensis]
MKGCNEGDPAARLDPSRLREHREAHGLTLEAAGDRLRETARRHGLAVPAANFQTLWGHEHGSIYPGPHYRRAYCLMYQATEPDLGFRGSSKLSGVEESAASSGGGAAGA